MKLRSAGTPVRAMSEFHNTSRTVTRSQSKALGGDHRVVDSRVVKSTATRSLPNQKRPGSREKKECKTCIFKKPLSVSTLPFENTYLPTKLHRHHFPRDDSAHSHGTCNACITRHAGAELQYHGNWTRLRCIGCDESMQRLDFVRLLPKKEMREYVSFRRTLFDLKGQFLICRLHRLQRVLTTFRRLSHPRYRKCPALNCNYGQIKAANAKSPLTTCKGCGARSCFHHRMLWHDERSCEQYDDSPEGVVSKTAEQRVKEVSKRCPGLKGKCGVRIAKDGGCDHVSSPKSTGMRSRDIGGVDSMIDVVYKVPRILSLEQDSLRCVVE